MAGRNEGRWHVRGWEVSQSEEGSGSRGRHITRGSVSSCKDNSSPIGVTNGILVAEVTELRDECFRVALEGSQIFPSSQL